MNLSHANNLDLLLAAGAMLTLGFVLWLESVRWSRALVTLLMAGLGAYIGFLAPALWHPDLARLTTVIIGIVLGVVLGAVGFRLIQALLAGCLLAALLGGALAWHDGAFSAVAAHDGKSSPLRVASPPAATRQATHRSRLAGIGRGEKPHPSPPLWKRTIEAKYVWGNIERLPKTQRSEVLALAAGAMLVAVLVGLIFPLVTSLVIGAWLGSLLVLLSLALFALRLQPTFVEWSWEHLHPLWIYAGCGVLGMAIQYRHIHRYIRRGMPTGKTDKGGQKKPPRDAAPGV
ncbi:MAG: hypothetical protein M1588_04840 [Planctomycetes bacterium]|nr:hypothetical protein [Planctomycetota bacterium]